LFIFLYDFRRTIRWFEPINCVRVMVESLPGTLPWILQRSYCASVLGSPQLFVASQSCAVPRQLGLGTMTQCGG
jgi:hypothetical protein